MTCARCGRGPSGDNLDDLEWEVVDGQDVCPDCVTPAEAQALDEDVMRLADSTPAGDPRDPRATLRPVEGD